jgi:protein phosphatase
MPAKSLDRFQLRGHLFVVADGMGAHAAGELASRMATERIALHYFKSQSAESSGALQEAITEANAEIHRRGQQNPEFYNMGTTASSLVLTSFGAIVGHVGDSRVYRLRNSDFEQLTFDHSLVWELEASGHIIAGQPFRGPIPKNVITRSLGPNAEVNIDLEGPFPIQKGDTFLICSDGLTGQVEDPELAAILDALPVDRAARVLIDLANLRGGPDNITVIVVRITDDGDFVKEMVAPTKPKLQQIVSPILLGIVAACITFALLFAFIAIFGHQEDAGSWWGKMVVVLSCGAIAGGMGYYEYRLHHKNANRDPGPLPSGGNAPYRHCRVPADSALIKNLGGTVEALRQAAKTRNWFIDWDPINKLESESRAAMKQGQLKKALGLEAEAIIASMQQLRDKRDRSTDDGSIDY